MNLVPATFNKFVLASAALLVVVIAQSVEGQGPGPRLPSLIPSRIPSRSQARSR